MLETLVIVVTVFFGAAAQAVTGFGFGLIVVPLLSLMMPPWQAIVLSLLLPIPLNIWILAEAGFPRSRVRLFSLIVSAVAALPAGVYVVSVLPPAVLRIIIGCLTLVLTTLVVSGRPIVARHSLLGDLLVGAASGIASGATGMGGPLLGIVLLGRIPDMVTYRSVLLLYLVVLNTCSLLLLALVTPVWEGIGPALPASVPALVAGIAAGRFVFVRIAPRGVRRLVLVLASAAGAASLGYGLLQLWLS